MSTTSVSNPTVISTSIPQSDSSSSSSSVSLTSSLIHAINDKACEVACGVNERIENFLQQDPDEVSIIEPNQLHDQSIMSVRQTKKGEKVGEGTGKMESRDPPHSATPESSPAPKTNPIQGRAALEKQAQAFQRHKSLPPDQEQQQQNDPFVKTHGDLPMEEQREKVQAQMAGLAEMSFQTKTGDGGDHEERRSFEKNEKLD